VQLPAAVTAGIAVANESQIIVALKIVEILRAIATGVFRRAVSP